MGKKCSLVLLLILTLTGCVKETWLQNNGLSFNCFKVSFEQDNQTKVHLEEGNAVKWDDGDRIFVFSDLQTTPTMFERERDGQFRGGTVTGNRFFAYYPELLSPDTEAPLRITIPSECLGIYRKVDFHMLPMVAQSTDNSLSFKQTCGVIHFSIQSDDGRCECVTFQGNEMETVSGSASLEIDAETPVARFKEDGGNMIWYWQEFTLDGGTDIYVVLPPMTFNKGFTIRYRKRGSEEWFSRSTLKRLTVERGIMYHYVLDKNEDPRATEEDREEERNSLIALYSATGGSDWTFNENWCSDEPVEQWYGVETDIYGFVRRITLFSNNLSGRIPDDIGALSHLETLELFENPDLTGTLPTTIGKLSNLRMLNLNTCNLLGPLPSEIGNLGNLETLHLFFNENLSGSIPPEIGQLANIKSIRLEHCNLSGNLPEGLVNLQNLEWFACGFNPLLSGTVPGAFAHWNYWKEGWGDMVVETGLKWSEETTPTCPVFSVTTLDGTTVTSDIIKDNKLTVLFQWATWCPFTPQFLPLLKSAYHRFKDKGFDVLGWTTEQDESAIRQYISDNGMAWQNFLYSSPDTPPGPGYNHIGAEGAREYPTGSYPAITAFDNEGKLVYTNVTGASQMETFGPFVAQWFDDPEWNWQEGSQAYESTDFSRDGQVHVLQEATVGAGIDLVILGDGYSDRLIADGTYEKVVLEAMEAFFSIEPYKTLRKMFNVKMIDVVSSNEGIWEGANTALSTRWLGDTNVGGNDDKVIEYVSKTIPGERLDDCVSVVLINSNFYAGRSILYIPHAPSGWGSGFSIAYFPANREYLAYLMCHEAGGHCFAKLDDEYVMDSGRIDEETIANLKEGATQFGWHKNIDFTSDPTLVKWSHFLQDSRYRNEDLGVFEGAYYYAKGAYRPSYNSIMNDRDPFYFNAPSREAIWYRAHKLAFGPDWEYSYEDFVAYDAINRASVSAAAAPKTKANYVEQVLPPLASPVEKGRTWKDGLNENR